MSTEPKPPATTATTAPATGPAPVTPPEPKAEPNALATALGAGWEQFKQGQLISYRMMAVVLLLVAGIGTTIYITRSNRKVESGKWTELESLSSVSSLREYAEKNPNTMQGRLAALDAARVQLGPDGIDRLAAPAPDARKAAVENVEKARDTFAKLADEFKDNPILRVECLKACATAEVALIGVLKDGSTDQFRGDPKKAIEYLDKVTETAPDTDWGKDAKKLADTLRNQNTADQVKTLQASVYTVATPAMPGFEPKAPGAPGGLGDLGGIPGLPGR